MANSHYVWCVSIQIFTLRFQHQQSQVHHAIVLWSLDLNLIKLRSSLDFDTLYYMASKLYSNSVLYKCASIKAKKSRI
jgi:hypothetical protein